MNSESSQNGDKPTSRNGILDNMAPNIAIIVLFAYVILLFVLTGISCFNTNQAWMELTKAGFTTLGSALTLILGYYFGQKQVAEEAKRETQATNEQLVKERQKTSQLVELAKATATPSEPDDLSALDQSRLQAGRPAGAAQPPSSEQSDKPSSSSSSSSSTI